MQHMQDITEVEQAHSQFLENNYCRSLYFQVESFLCRANFIKNAQ